MSVLLFSPITITLTLFFFFFNDTATTEIYTLSLHDALPICTNKILYGVRCELYDANEKLKTLEASRIWKIRNIVHRDRKSTRLNSSHGYISYAVFCLKKKKKRNGRHVCMLFEHPPVYELRLL